MFIRLVMVLSFGFCAAIFQTVQNVPQCSDLQEIKWVQYQLYVCTSLLIYAVYIHVDYAVYRMYIPHVLVMGKLDSSSELNG